MNRKGAIMSSYGTEYMKKRRAEWKAQGKCINCGREPDVGPRGGKSMCKSCREKLRDNNKKHKDLIVESTRKIRKERMKHRLCVYCGNPSEPGPRGSTRWCASCREKWEGYRNPESESEYRWNNRLAAIREYGGLCEKCGHDNPVVLMFHHTNGDGKEERANGHGKDALIRSILENGRRDDIQLLCANCHFAIHWSRPF